MDGYVPNSVPQRRAPVVFRLCPSSDCVPLPAVSLFRLWHVPHRRAAAGSAVGCRAWEAKDRSLASRTSTTCRRSDRRRTSTTSSSSAAKRSSAAGRCGSPQASSCWPWSAGCSSRSETHRRSVGTRRPAVRGRAAGPCVTGPCVTRACVTGSCVTGTCVTGIDCCVHRVEIGRSGDQARGDR